MTTRPPRITEVLRPSLETALPRPVQFSDAVDTIARRSAAAQLGWGQVDNRSHDGSIQRHLPPPAAIPCRRAASAATALAPSRRANVGLPLTVSVGADRSETLAVAVGSLFDEAFVGLRALGVSRRRLTNTSRSSRGKHRRSSLERRGRSAPGAFRHLALSLGQAPRAVCLRGGGPGR